MFFPPKPDPKDAIIDLLKDERAYLRAKVTDLEAQLLAIHNAHAYRLLYRPPANDPLPGSGESTVYEQRGTVFDPNFSLLKLEQRMKGTVTD